MLACQAPLRSSAPGLGTNNPAWFRFPRLYKYTRGYKTGITLRNPILVIGCIKIYEYLAYLLRNRQLSAVIWAQASLGTVQNRNLGWVCIMQFRKEMSTTLVCSYCSR